MLNMYSLFALVVFALVSKVFTSPAVLVLSFDGFHPKYLTKEDTPHLYHTLMPLGAGPPYMTSIFPTKTMVTHFSLATGSYPEDHGVYNNEVFDNDGQVIRNESFQFKNNRGIIPIWIENQKAGNHSALMMWPGGDFEYEGYSPTYNQIFDKKITWEERADTIVNWMKSTENKPNLVMAYFEDSPCYEKSKRPQHFKEYKRRVDDTIKLIYEGLKNANIHENIDMMIISDHGTEPIEGNQIMKIEDYVTTSTSVKTIVSGPLVFIKTNKENFNSELTKLKEHKEFNMTFMVRTKDTFNAKLRMNAKSLENTIILIAKYGYSFSDKKTLDSLVATVGGKDNLVVDVNGYDTYDSNMNAFFLGIGPSFKNMVTTVNSFCLIEVYSLLKKFLNLTTTLSYDQGQHVTMKKQVKLLLEGYRVEEDRVHFYYRHNWRDWRLIEVW